MLVTANMEDIVPPSRTEATAAITFTVDILLENLVEKYARKLHEALSNGEYEIVVTDVPMRDDSLVTCSPSVVFGRFTRRVREKAISLEYIDSTVLVRTVYNSMTAPCYIISCVDMLLEQF